MEPLSASVRAHGVLEGPPDTDFRIGKKNPLFDWTFRYVGILALQWRAVDKPWCTSVNAGNPIGVEKLKPIFP